MTMRISKFDFYEEWRTSFCCEVDTCPEKAIYIAWDDQVWKMEKQKPIKPTAGLYWHAFCKEHGLKFAKEHNLGRVSR